MDTVLITPVGTSLFENYLDSRPDGQDVSRYRPEIRHEPGSRWDDRMGQIDAIRRERTFTDWIRTSKDASAETESIAKIASQAEGPVAVRLLASDTIESRLAAELIGEHSDLGEVEFQFTPKNDQIGGLQVFDDEAFTDGIRNLVARVRGILEDYGELMGQESGGSCAINITGGYKATLPYLTVLGELYDVPLHYKFEDADGLLSIPQVPITLDEALFREHEAEFSALEEIVDDWASFKEDHHAFKERAGDLIEVVDEDNMAGLSPLGKLFWDYYTDQYVFFHAPDDVYEAIRDEQPNVRRILRTKMNQLLGGNQVGPKGDHLAFDDGKNSNRIFFFEDEGELYIYQTFDEEEDYDDYDSYWRDTTFTDAERKRVKKRSERRRLRRDDNR